MKIVSLIIKINPLINEVVHLLMKIIPRINESNSSINKNNSSELMKVIYLINEFIPNEFTPLIKLQAHV